MMIKLLVFKQKIDVIGINHNVLNIHVKHTLVKKINVHIFIHGIEQNIIFVKLYKVRVKQ